MGDSLKRNPTQHKLNSNSYLQGFLDDSEDEDSEENDDTELASMENSNDDNEKEGYKNLHHGEDKLNKETEEKEEGGEEEEEDIDALIEKAIVENNNGSTVSTIEAKTYISKRYNGLYFAQLDRKHLNFENEIKEGYKNLHH